MQTTDVVSATWNAGEAAVIGYIQPQGYNRRIVLMALVGPANASLKIYRGYRQVPAMLISSVYPADIRTYDSVGGRDSPIQLSAGEAATFAWTGGSSGVGQVATATVTSEVG